jgi:hypothetical protein
MPPNRPNQDYNGGDNNGSAYEQKSRRPEMRGPTTDVSDMMSRLKTKTINIQQPSSSAGAGAASYGSSNGNASEITLTNILTGMSGSSSSSSSSGINDVSNVISVTDLGDIPNDSTPHKSKRRPRSERNTVSLDL